ncbi:HD domain-containing protein [Candidatus Uhrbacteria bacterium]|nr:HD domain-containing protein [Candidatus Uhrbacteria bacterium]
METQQQLVIEKTAAFVKMELRTAEAGHDWWHIFRVWKLAQRIAEEEKVDVFVVELGALLHDIADSKFHSGDETVGPKKARIFLESIDVSADVIIHVTAIIEHISFKGGRVEQKFHSPELDVVQDADRLDAIGAIGIARTFNYGGFKNRELYNPEISPNLEMRKEEYKNSTAPTINHFYEKLLLLKDRMNTRAGRKLAEHRHAFIEVYLEEFLAEWDGLR